MILKGRYWPALECIHSGLSRAKNDGSGGNNCICKMCIAPVKIPSPANHHTLFTGWMPFPSPNQPCRSSEGRHCLSNDIIFVVYHVLVIREIWLSFRSIMRYWNNIDHYQLIVIEVAQFSADICTLQQPAFLS